MGTGFSAVVQENVSQTSAAFHLSFLDWHTWTVYGAPGKAPLGIRFLPVVIVVGAFVVGAVVGMGVCYLLRQIRSGRVGMIDLSSKKTCSGCQKPLPEGAPDGLCPGCLMKAGLGTGVDIGPDSQPDSGQTRFVAPTPDELAKLFPQLEIIALIGQGGMGAVYRARQKELDRLVALKILPPGIGKDPAFAERFTREAKALAKLNHPGIVTIHDFGRTDGLFYFLMEFVDGVSLRHLLEGERISAREALAIVPQICDALQYAHDEGIVHRDIKPENILLDRLGRVKVADFGLAKLVGTEAGGIPLTPSLSPSGGEGAPALTDAGKVMGTPQYMAPEQREHPTEVDHRADIYSLGVVFYQMLTGELPGKPIEAPSHKVQIDVRLDEVVLRALEKEPQRRYQQVSQVKTAVETIATSAAPGRSPNQAEVPQPFPKWLLFRIGLPKWPARPAATRSRLRAALIVGVLVWLFVTGTVTLITWIRPESWKVVAVISCPLKSQPGRPVKEHFKHTATMIELMRSDVILGRVIDRLQLDERSGKLDERWGKRNLGLKLTKAQAMVLLKRRLDVRSEGGTLIQVGVFGKRPEEPEEAMDIANTIAEELRAFRIEQHESPADMLEMTLRFTPPNLLLGLAAGFVLGLLAGGLVLWRGFLRRGSQASQVKTAVETIDQSCPPADANPQPADWRTWSPFQSPQVREICDHMTEAERREWTLRGALFGIWNAATFFVPWGIAFFAPKPLNWIFAPIVLVVGLGFYPLWRRITREFLASTRWARQQGIAPGSLRMSPRIILVGRHSGHAVIRWPGVLLVFMLVLAVAEAGAIFASSVLMGWIDSRSVGVAFVSSVLFMGILVRRGLRTPVEHLTTLDVPSGTGPRPAGEKSAGAWNIFAPDAPRWATALLAAAAVLIPLGAFVGKGLIQGAKPTQHVPSLLIGIAILLAVGALALFLAWQATRHLRTRLRPGAKAPNTPAQATSPPIQRKFVRTAVVALILSIAGSMTSILLGLVVFKSPVGVAVFFYALEMAALALGIVAWCRHAGKVAVILAVVQMLVWVPGTLWLAAERQHEGRKVEMRRRSPAAQNEFRAPLPQGEIALVGVSYHPSTNQPWWRPDGSPCPEGPFELRSSTSSATGESMTREFVIRLTGLPADASGPVWRLDRGSWAGSSVYVRGQPVPTLQGISATVPKSARTVTVKVGVGMGAWETVANQVPGGSGITGVSRQGSNWVVSFPKAEGGQGGARILVTHTVRDWETRVLAVDQDDKEHLPTGSESSGTDAFTTLSAKFPDLPLDRVKEFQFQVRPYQWVEFRNVVLDPRHLETGKGPVVK